jgi:hypothetical protein
MAEGLGSGEAMSERGPCPKPCAECSDGWHHFSDAMRTESGDYVCKHCDATTPDCQDCGEAVEFHRPQADVALCVECDKAAASRYWPHEKKPRKPWLVVIVENDYDLRYDHFNTGEEARTFVKEQNRKACVVGPETVEDCT